MFEPDHIILWEKYLCDENKFKRDAYIQEIPLDMRGKVWRDFISDVKILEFNPDFFDWYKIYKSEYIKEINMVGQPSSSTNNIWKKTNDKTVEMRTYPPFEEIEVDWKGIKIVAAPFKEITDNSELNKIKSQNNYTNQMLKTLSDRIEDISFEKREVKIEKPIIDPRNDWTFKLDDDQRLVDKITKQLEALDLKKKQIATISEKEQTDQSEEESLAEQFEEKIELNRINRYDRPRVPHFYPRPSLPDVQNEERWTQGAFDGRSIYEWNIDGKSEQGIMDTLNEMCMAASASKNIGNNDIDVTKQMVTGFSGQLKGWWDHYLSDADRTEIMTKIKPEIINGQAVTTPNTFATLIYAITKNFIGNPQGIAEKASTILITLTCPKLQDFRWYKDMFLSKLYLREDSQQPYWKERFIGGLPKLFGERIRNRLKKKSSDHMLRYESLTYGELINEINLEGLEICNEMKLKSKLKQEKLSGRRELGSFCEQYGYEKISAPSARVKSKMKRQVVRKPFIKRNLDRANKPYIQRYSKSRYGKNKKETLGLDLWPYML